MELSTITSQLLDNWPSL